MADIFVSYKAEDRARLAALVAALEADGFSVWWDARIGGGAHWRETIETELDAASCVIVAWSRESTGPAGRFVRDEATRALRREVYLPVRLDAVDPPLGFGEVQALDLIGWKGNRADPRYRAVCAAAAATLGREAGAAMHATPAARRVDRRAVLAGGGVLAALALSGGGVIAWRRHAAASGDSIVVMPFANLSGDPGQAYFSDGLAEELRATLARLPALKVIGRTSSEKLRDADAVEAARTLGVANVLTGSVRRSASLIRVSAQLVDGHNGVERWSESYDRPPGDTLAIQSDIAQKVAQALRIRLGAVDRAALVAGGTANAAAYDLFLKGQALTVGLDGGGDEPRRQALAFFDAALNLDPHYAEALAFRALTLMRIASASSDTPESIRRQFAAAARIARQAVDLAPRMSAGYSALGAILVRQFDFRGAMRAYRQALALDAGHVDNFCRFLADIGRAGEALPIIDRAIALDPLDPNSLNLRCYVLVLGRRYADGIAAARELERMFHWDLSIAYVYAYYFLGRLAEAEAALEKQDREDPANWQVVADIMARTGRRREAEALALRLEAANRQRGDLNVVPAELYARWDRTDQAMAALERAFALRDLALVQLPSDPFLDPLRPDPRFKALQARLNFP